MLSQISQKRRFFIDEDSWGAAVVDQYDSTGDIWRVSMAYLKNYYEVPVTLTSFDVYHDVKAKRYHVQGLDNEERSTIDFSLELPNDQYFTPSALRRRGKR